MAKVKIEKIEKQKNGVYVIISYKEEFEEIIFNNGYITEEALIKFCQNFKEFIDKRESGNNEEEYKLLKSFEGKEI